jgi:phosphate transport system permease protein
LTVTGAGVVVILALIVTFLFQGALPAIRKFGLAFPFTSTWDPVRELYGALPVIYGTVVSSLLGMLIAAPLSIGIALFLNEQAPERVRRPVGFLVEMLAAIPSVVYGLWGIFVLAPWLRTTVEPFLGRTLGFLPLFQGPPYGVGMLSASIILAIMVIPTVSSIAKEVFRAIPRAQREAALALGATRAEMMWLSVVKTARAGIFGAVCLGLGRAIGETMAVTMVIGNRAEIAISLFAPSQTMASVIANEYAEATSDMHLAALAGIGLALFAVTFVMNATARLIVWRFARRLTK